MSILARKLGRDILRQWPQFTAVVAVVLLGIALYGASYAAYQNLRDSYATLFDRLHFADLIVTGGSTRQFAAEALHISGVQAVELRRVADVPIAVGTGHKLLGRVVGMPAGREPSVDRVALTAGSGLEAGDPSGVLAEQHLARHFHLRPGSRLRVYGRGGWHDVTVRGVAASAEYLWPARSRQDILTSPDTFGVLFVPEGLADRLAGPGTPGQVVVSLTPEGRRGTALGALQGLARRLSATEVLTREQQPSNATLTEDINGFGELAYLFPLLFLSAAGMAAYILLIRLVQAQRAQIGTLVANGVRPRTILLHYLGYGVAVGVVGGALGTLLGFVLAAGVTDAYTGAISLPQTVTRVYPETIVVGLILAVLAGGLASLSPAWSAMRLAPAEAMRGAGPSGTGGAGLPERLIPPLARLSATGKLILRGLSRRPRRTLSTAAGVLLACILILVSWGLLDSMDALLVREYGGIQRQDAQVYLSRPVDLPALAGLERVSGVSGAEPLAEMSATVRSGNRSYDATLLGFQPHTTMHRFPSPGGQDQALPDRGVLVGAALQSKLGISIGDRVVVRLPGLHRALTETVRGLVDEPIGTYVYASFPALQRSLGLSSGVADAVLVRYRAGVDRAAVRGALAGRSTVVAVADTQLTADALRSIMGLFQAFVGIMLAFGAVMAFAMVFSTMAVNIAERSVELTTLRVAGVGQSRLAWLVTTENLLLTGLTLPLGLLVGYECARLFAASFSSDLFRFDLAMLPRTPVLSALAILAVTLACQWPASRAIRSLHLAAIVRERSI